MNHRSMLTEDEVRFAILDFHRKKFNYNTKRYTVTINLEDWTVNMIEKEAEKLSFRARFLASLFGL